MKQFCCQQMTEALNHQCSQHPNLFVCPDKLIHYSPKFDEYGLVIHDGGSSVCEISYCPWCGAKLPDSRREQWFNTLEMLGYNDPWNEDLPKEFLTDEWYAKK